MITEKMRCHPTIILEKTGGFLMLWILLALSQAEHILAFFRKENFQENLSLFLPLLGFLILLPLPVTVYHFLVWRKTFIYLEERTLVVECNTIRRKKNTYGISYISNINMEQNLFELLMHTCRLKLDMANVSSAGSTDISIVLSLKKAQELKALLLSSPGGGQGDSCPSDSFNQKTDLGRASFSDILSHCIFSLPGSYLIFALCLTLLLGILFFNGDLNPSGLLFSEGEHDFFTKAFTVFFLAASYGYQILKRLLGFYRFSAFRQGDDMIVHYGFFRKQDYTIPVTRIQALQIVQPPIARLTGRCEVRIVCVGIGDSDQELTQLSLCRKKAEVYSSLQECLPEFPISSLNSMRRPPKHASILYACSCLGWILLCCLLPCLLLTALEIPEIKGDDFLWAGICGFTALCFLLYHLLHYGCLGYSLEGPLGVFSGGSLTCTVTMVPYDRIQHLCFHQNPLSHCFHLSRGEVCILASILNRTVSFPYMTDSDKTLLIQKIEGTTWAGPLHLP
ncbi:MAG: PH domain-containing protein [Lachnospiraceae bacterium]|nr:PH domain-containing protein [Lachnospiraceae bacterium]